ncbi:MULTISPECIES: crotonase/enoyl-CoA hydratase family protein [Sphingomonadales]|uniref:Enoyl-CoA hydratase n=2 Tax=Sphingomonadaceae TaxID=41297 RepID=T0GZP7_9SPHN|nr:MULTISPECIES: enoyl-CoA hydratase-related protein [Sphingomonadaceae]EQB09466.1 hypothetical protein L284_19685 [Novosphingobium lindaniclasticum LE124]EQB11140.1 hypothetical protein RLDS_24920 [Sphingobium lactosutens DS20]
MNYQTIKYEIDETGIALLLLNRPDRLNAFTVEMCQELEHFYRAASLDDSIRAIIVSGEGRAFCAGMDLGVQGNVFGLSETLQPTLEDMNKRLHDEAIRDGIRDTGGRVTLAMYDCLKPIIGAIHGAAVGIGITMTLPMDIRLATRDARIGFVFGRIGIVPEACSSWFLPRIVGEQTALEWTLTADIIDADTAHAGGLVRSVYDDHATMLEEAYALARRMTQNRSPVAVALTRQMMRRNPALPHPVEAHKIDSLAVLHASRLEGKEGVSAFLEKREPRFTGKASELSFFPWELTDR